MLQNTVSSLFSLSENVPAGSEKECSSRQKHLCWSLFISLAHYFRHESIPISKGGCVCFAFEFARPLSGSIQTAAKSVLS